MGGMSGNGNVVSHPPPQTALWARRCMAVIPVTTKEKLSISYRNAAGALTVISNFLRRARQFALHLVVFSLPQID